MGVMFGQQRGDVASKHEFSATVCTRSENGKTFGPHGYVVAPSA